MFEGADLDNAALNIASTWTFHSGQICTAPTRVIAQRGIYERLVLEAALPALRGTSNSLLLTAISVIALVTSVVALGFALVR